MHSRIFQISEQPIQQEDYINETYFYDHWFLNRIADYVNDDTDRQDDIEWLKTCCSDDGISFGEDKDGAFLIIEDKHKFFEKSFARFQECLSNLLNKTLDDFISYSMSMDMYRLNNSYNDDCGFYTYHDGELVTFDEFVRYYKTNTKYYFGATIDYHY